MPCLLLLLLGCIIQVQWNFWLVYVAVTENENESVAGIAAGRELKNLLLAAGSIHVYSKTRSKVHLDPNGQPS